MGEMTVGTPRIQDNLFGSKFRLSVKSFGLSWRHLNVHISLYAIYQTISQIA
jgi:hypothetical protein